MTFKFALCFCAAMAWAAPAFSQVTAKNPLSIVAAMQAEGYAAKLEKDNVGDPKIQSSSSGSSFSVYFYNCTDNVDCATVQFRTSYETEPKQTLEQINNWNRTQRFGRAYLTEEGTAALEMDVDLHDGGISPLLFADNLEFWIAVMARFEEHIGW